MKRLAPIVVALFVLALLPGTASAWAPADRATIHPGVQTVTDGAGQCTSNFIFTRGSDTYIGQSAHCSGTGATSARPQPSTTASRRCSRRAPTSW